MRASIRKPGFWRAVYQCLVSDSLSPQQLEPLTAAPLDTLNLVNHQYVVTLLYARLRDSSALNGFPSDMVGLMEQLYSANLRRNEAIIAQCGRLTETLNSVGITPLFLKGGAFLLDEVIPDRGMRILSDMDLCIPSDKLELAEKTLLEAGYSALNGRWKPGKPKRTDLHHLPPMAHPDEPAQVELHQAILVGSYQSLLPASAFYADSRLNGGKPGSRYRLPSVQWLLKHHFVHHYLQDEVYAHCKVWDLRQLSDLHFLLNRYAGTINFVELDRYFDEHGYKNAWDCYKLEYRQVAGWSPFPLFRPPLTARLSVILMRLRIAGPIVNQTMDYMHRLPRLPKRLVTPSWYLEKYRFLFRESRNTD